MATADLIMEMTVGLYQMANRVFSEAPSTLTRDVQCWMVYFWRAIALNGMTMMHVQRLQTNNSSVLLKAWRLLILRVWAASVECTRIFTPEQHPDICASVLSGRPTVMPGWARRGMPIPFIFDIVYCVGVAYSQEMSFQSTAAAHFMYHCCFEALLGLTTVENAFIKNDPFLVHQLQMIPNTVGMTRVSMDEYIKLTRNCEIGSILRPNNSADQLYANLLRSLQVAINVNGLDIFQSVYQLPINGHVPTTLQWDKFFV